MVSTITPQELASLQRSGEPVDLLDVRTPAEFHEFHATIARNVPLERLDPRALMAARQPADVTALYVICRSGSRGKQACEKLLAAGLPAVVNVEGGTLAWEAAGLPVIRGKQTISLERQVRIALGSLVLIAAFLSFFLHPYWIGLVAFMGASLMFSGVADFCGMAMLLARMPWNQVRTGDGSHGMPACGGSTK